MFKRKAASELRSDTSDDSSEEEEKSFLEECIIDARLACPAKGQKTHERRI